MDDKNIEEIPRSINNALGYNIYRVSLLIRRQLKNALSEYKLTPEQWQIMASLWASSSYLNQKALVDITLKDKHTLSRIVQRLERDGWVQKKEDNEDKRSYYVLPSKKSLKYKNIIPVKIIEHFQPIFDILTDIEKQVLSEYLNRIRNNLE